MGLLPSKEERRKNREENKERSHWSRMVIIVTGILLYNVQIMNASEASWYVYFSIPGLVLVFIPLISVYRHRDSQEKKRRLLAKDLSELYFMLSAVLPVIFLFSLFNTAMPNVTVRGILAGVSGAMLLAGGFYLKRQYAHLAAIQTIDPSEDRVSLNHKRNWLFIAIIVTIVIIIIYFNLIL